MVRHVAFGHQGSRESVNDEQSPVEVPEEIVMSGEVGGLPESGRVVPLK
jgi:hypothetical protein